MTAREIAEADQREVGGPDLRHERVTLSETLDIYIRFVGRCQRGGRILAVSHDFARGLPRTITASSVIRASRPRACRWLTVRSIAI